MLKLSTQGIRFESNYSSCTGRSSENIYNSSRGGQEKMKKRMKLSLPPKLLEKVIYVPVISFFKISFPVKHLMPNYAETGSFNLSLLC
jgi:hypothetical protein